MGRRVLSTEAVFDDLTTGLLPMFLSKLNAMPIFDGSNIGSPFIATDHVRSDPVAMETTMEPLGDAIVSGTWAFLVGACAKAAGPMADNAVNVASAARVNVRIDVMLCFFAMGPSVVNDVNG
jgi:hypothetical protein